MIVFVVAGTIAVLGAAILLRLAVVLSNAVVQLFGSSAILERLSRGKAIGIIVKGMVANILLSIIFAVILPLSDETDWVNWLRLICSWFIFSLIISQSLPVTLWRSFLIILLMYLIALLFVGSIALVVVGVSMAMGLSLTH